MDLQATVLHVIAEIAPEADLEVLDPQAPLAEELDLDSLDFHAIVAALHEQTGVEVPERDLPQLRSLQDCVAYLQARVAPATQPG